MLLDNHIKAEHLSEFKLDPDTPYLNHAAVSPGLLERQLPLSNLQMKM
jgi:hypothetical protein